MRIACIAAVAALAAGCFGGMREQAPPPLVYRVDAPSLAAGTALPVDLKVVEERTVGPDLGADSIRKGMIAMMRTILATSAILA